MLRHLLVIFMFFLTMPVFANNADFSKLISNSNVSKSGVSVYVVDMSTGKDVYKLHSKQYFHPASVQKLITYKVAEQKLGKDFSFDTILYKNSKDEYLIKLAADPLLTTSDLKNLVSHISPGAKAIYIDDSVVDSSEWGEGWQWDDDLNPLMPKFSAYNLDGNLIKINFMPTVPGAPAEISQEKFYPLSFVNEVVTGDSNNVKLDRKNYIAPDMIVATGSVKTLTSKTIPVNNAKRYFKLSLERILNDEKIDYSGVYKSMKVTPDFKEVAKVSHPLSAVSVEVLKNSNNMATESLFKVASSSNEEFGTFLSSYQILETYCENLKIDSSEIKMVDASGVSKNNLLTAEFVVDFLANKENIDIKELLPTAGEGTLLNRMNYMTGKLRAKTGTLSDTSSIAGYIDSKSGNTYAFCIMISDPKSKNADKKMLEEYLLREIYTKL